MLPPDGFPVRGHTDAGIALLLQTRRSAFSASDIEVVGSTPVSGAFSAFDDVGSQSSSSERFVACPSRRPLPAQSASVFSSQFKNLASSLCG